MKWREATYQRQVIRIVIRMFNELGERIDDLGEDFNIEIVSIKKEG